MTNGLRVVWLACDQLVWHLLRNETADDSSANDHSAYPCPVTVLNLTLLCVIYYFKKKKTSTVCPHFYFIQTREIREGYR